VRVGDRVREAHEGAYGNVVELRPGGALVQFDDGTTAFRLFAFLDRVDDQEGVTA
jgi:hypothetical protein